MKLKPGATVGAYEILAAVGEGGMGEVYRARDAALGRDVAIKVLASAFSRDEERLRRFVQEAQAAAALNHPNILAIHHIGQHDGSPFIVSELLEGETLRSRLNEGPLPLRKAIDYAVQISRGLGAAHEKGIIHRDLKPENVFVTEDGRVKILDFGIAKLTRSNEADDTREVRTDAGSVLGTLGYMAPEQVRGQIVDPRADLFSLGAILYEMLSGKRAFKKDTAADTMTAILREDPPDLGTATRQLPPALERIVKRCLEKNPQERLQSARDLAFALEDLTTISTTGRMAAAAETPRGSRKALVAAAAIAVVLLAGVAGAAWRALTMTPEAEPTYHRLTFRRGTLLRARFAPDGKTVVYGAAWDGLRPETFMVTADSPESRALGIPNSDVYAVSSTGELAISLRNSLAFPPIRGILARAPLLGGAAPREVMNRVEYADFAPDGSIAVTIDTGVGDRLEYPIGTTILEIPSPIHQIRIAPDGGSIAYQEVAGALMSVSIVTKDKQKKVLSEGWALVNGLAWARGGAEIWFAGKARDASWGIYAVTPAGATRLLLRVPGDVRVEDVAADGRLLMARETRQSGISSFTTGAPLEVDLSWLDGSRLSDLSADGKQILFTENGAAGGPGGAVYLRKTDGSPAVRLGSGVGAALSPDGRWALTTTRDPLGMTILPTGAGSPIKLKGQFPRYVGGAWLDDKRIVFAANEPKHGPRLYVQELSGDPRPISPEGVIIGAALAPDGRIATLIDGKALIINPAGGAPQPLPGVTAGDIPVAWTADGRSVYVSRGELPVEISIVDVATGARKAWKTLAPPDRAGTTNVGGIRIGRDGKSYAYSYTRVLSELYLVNGVR